MGYGFLFDPPKGGPLTASVNVPVLLAQWFAAALVCMVVCFLAKGEANSSPTAQRVRDPGNKSFFESALFGLVRLCRGIVGVIFAWQVIGLFPLFTWFSDPSAVTAEMIGTVVLKAIMLVVLGLLFFRLRKFIHWLHHRWYGSPHPALAKVLAL